MNPGAMEYTLEQVQPRSLPMGFPALDDLLGGGIYTKRITEFCGAPATAKTTLCLGVALAAQQTDTRPVYYVNSEPCLIMRRLASLQPQFPGASLERVMALKRPVYTAEALLWLLESHEIDEIFAQGVSVFIVDTLPWLEVREIQQLISRLRDLAIRYDTAVIITNGVVGTKEKPNAYIDGVSWCQERPHLTGTPQNSEWVDSPKLGWTLTRLVDSRILLSRSEHSYNGPRKISLLYSGDTKPASLEFSLDPAGLFQFTCAPT